MQCAGGTVVSASGFPHYFKDALSVRYPQEKWHPVEKSSRRESPSLRLRCQFQSVDVLPLREYDGLVYLLRDEYRRVCRLLEPHVPVRTKEELSRELMAVFHSEDVAEDALAELVAEEVGSVEDAHLAFRGNSIATKAMEAYLKLVGGRYLQATLQPVVQEIVSSEEVDLEVDPVKVGDLSGADLQQHRANLRTAVKQVWSRVAGSHSYFPPRLQRCFHKVRQYLEHVGRTPEVADNLVSSCIFLRYLCPAILSPSLFGLTEGFPGERANRNLTLVAKTVQTLANFSRYEGRDNAMAFLNPFLEEERAPMRAFLRQISSPVPEEQWMPDLTSSSNPAMDRAELGRHLSCLHTILFENVSKVTVDDDDDEDAGVAARLREQLDEINQLLRRPTMPQLEQISQPTMTTLKQIQDAESAAAAAAAAKFEHSSSSSSLSKFSWWTLPKKRAGGGNGGGVGGRGGGGGVIGGGGGGVGIGGGLSHPAPHHEARHRRLVPAASFARPEPAVVSSSLDSSDSGDASAGAAAAAAAAADDSPSSATSLSPSPASASVGVGAGAIGTLGRHHPHQWPPHRVSSTSAIAIHHSQQQQQQQQCDRPKTTTDKKKGKFASSSFSLDGSTEESSDDSTYSSQCQSDANSTPRCAAGGGGGASSQTLPRPLTGAAHGYSTHTRHR